MRIYLDNCCLNRPFDDQSQERVRLEAEATLRVQDCIRVGILDLVWSYVLETENAVNPFETRKKAIGEWKWLARLEVGAAPEILREAGLLTFHGIKPLDALHLACAVAGGCKYFMTTDDGILRRRDVLTGVSIVNPVEFVEEVKP